MFRRLGAVVALLLSFAACGSAGEINPRFEPTVEISSDPSLVADSTTTAPGPTSAASTTTLAPTGADAATTDMPPEPTIYRPEPIREGDQATAVILPVEAAVLDKSSVTIRIVESADGRFLEVDVTNVVVPAGAAFWTTEIN